MDDMCTVTTTFYWGYCPARAITLCCYVIGISRGLRYFLFQRPLSDFFVRSSEENSFYNIEILSLTSELDRHHDLSY